jgi:hypothetical protein
MYRSKLDCLSLSVTSNLVLFCEQGSEPTHRVESFKGALLVYAQLCPQVLQGESNWQGETL